MITVDHLSKWFGSQVIFDDVSFNINSREIIGLVGRNGHGKTTLLRLLLNQMEPDEGIISFPNNYTVGYLDQHLKFTQDMVLDEGCLGLPKGREEERWRVEKVLSGLGFSKEDMYRHPDEFSGGYQVRLNLAKALVAEPDLLLLDEPTNYLDIVSIRWLTRFLKSWKTELVLITHDRNFMDGIITHTLGIHRQKIRKIAGPTSQYYNQILQDEEIYEKTRINDEKKRKEVEQFINRFRAKARLASMVQSRIKALERKGQRDKLGQIETLDFSFRAAPFVAKQMLETRDLAFSYEGHEPYLFEKLNITLGREDRVAVIGKNGKGKSTFLRVLAGELDPVQGRVQIHPSLKIGYFGQTNVDRLDPAKTVEEELLAADPDFNRQKVRSIAGTLMFQGDMALKKVSILSGGERSRVQLGKVLLSPCNLLLLDEPTNHLDMDSTDSLVAAVDEFPGTSVVVTHNETLLHTIATRLIVFSRDRAFVYEGTYQDFLDEIGWEDEDRPKGPKAPKVKAASGKAAPPPLNKTEVRRLRSQVIEERAKTLKPLQAGIEKAEKAIMRHEEEVKRNEQLIIEASANGSGERVVELSRRNHQLQLLIEESFAEMEKLTAEQQEHVRKFSEQLKALE